MPDWTAPFHRAKMTTEKFKEMKAKYVAKHGYTMTIPGLSDIIKVDFDQPLDEGEVKAWKRKDWKYFSPERYEDIKKMKQRKKEKFLNMLGSPTPHIVNNAGSIMTAIDDAQDALGTLAFIGLLAIKVAPRILGGVLGGPVGWTMAAADMLNTLQHLGYKKIPCLSSQMAMWKAEHNNAQSRKVKAVRAAKTMRWLPRQGRIIEAAQVSKDVFGIGLCLGPIVGFGIEAIMGPYRRITGAKVQVKTAHPWWPSWTRGAQIAMRSAPCYAGSGLQTDDDEVMLMTMANYLCRQEVSTAMMNWNAMDNVENIDEIELEAPVPKNILTREIIAEEGLAIKGNIGWPHSSRHWALMTDIVNELDQPCQGFANDFDAIHKEDWWPYAFDGLNNDATCYTLATAEGEEQIKYEYTAIVNVAQILTQFDLFPDPKTPKAKMDEFAYQIETWEMMAIKPNLRLIMEFCHDKEIKFLHFSTKF